MKVPVYDYISGKKVEVESDNVRYYKKIGGYWYCRYMGKKIALDLMGANAIQTATGEGWCN